LRYWVEYSCWTSHIYQRAITQRKPLFVETENTLTLGKKIKTKQTRSIVMQIYLLNSGYKITTHFFMLRIWAFQHYSILQIEKKKSMDPIGTIIWSLSHLIPLCHGPGKPTFGQWNHPTLPVTMQHYNHLFCRKYTPNYLVQTMPYFITSSFITYVMSKFYYN
jgi:hypothetical protein